MQIFAFPPITIIGAGNLATQLSFALNSNGYHIQSVLSKSGISAEILAKQLSCSVLKDFQEIPTKNLVFVCVNDSEIQQVISKLSHVEKLVFTAGNVSIDSIVTESKIGIFYPLQTFSKTKSVNFQEIPILLESHDESLRDLLFQLANKLSRRVEFIASKARKEVHLAAVFVNNFTNHLCFQANQHLEKHQLDWDLLKPLLYETIDKLNFQSPFDAQTGPARRQDVSTISDQYNRLSGNSRLIYEILTASIQQTYSDHDDKL
jgi:predicted short-subunit dehydrogenase-like oxidoreductase (DUF2520 family)